MSGAPVTAAVHAARLDRARDAMVAAGVDALLISVGHDMPYLVGYQAMPLERLTMLVLPREGRATLVIPRLEAPRVVHHEELFDLVAWDETQDPVAICDRLCGAARTVAVGDQMWSRFLVELIALRPTTHWRRASEVIGAMRAVKDAAEVAALRAAAEAVDRIAAELQAGNIPLVGRTEAQISAELSSRILAEGHDKVNFAIVAAGDNAASPHHHAGSRVVRPGEIVLCDFGGTMAGYCSDITRCVHVGEVPTEVAEAYEVLFRAQAAAVAAATVGTPCEEVDRAARSVIEDAGYGGWFVHRTGHGIGLEEHEDPYIVSGNATRLVAGHAFSIEPGIYVPGKWGMRLEDIVVASDAGPDALNRADHRLAVVDG
jgi:Xaa-Pro aminopeptidase